jgi:hypothetical protein
MAELIAAINRFLSIFFMSFPKSVVI